MQLCKLNYEKILTPHTHILTRRKRERRKKRLNINSRALDNGNLALLFCLCALTLAPAAACMSGRAKYCRSREGWVYTTPVHVRTGVDSAHCTVNTTRMSVYSVINNGIAWLPASAHFPAMTVASVVLRPGGCCPSRRPSSADICISHVSQPFKWLFTKSPNYKACLVFDSPFTMRTQNFTPYLS